MPPTVQKLHNYSHEGKINWSVYPPYMPPKAGVLLQNDNTSPTFGFAECTHQNLLKTEKYLVKHIFSHHAE